MTLGILSPEHQDKVLDAVAVAIVDTMIATYGPDEGPVRALAAVDHMIANPRAGCCDLDRVRRQCAELGISADSPVTPGPDAERLAADERADYDGGNER